MSSIPTSTQITESIVVPASLAQVWHLCKLNSFGDWMSALESSSPDENTSPEAAVSSWVFKDGSKATVKLEEHSSISHSITYSVIASEPALSYSSVVSTIRLFAVTTGEHENSTFVEWTGAFTGDATAEVIQDGRYKRKEALADLAKAASASKK